MSLALARKYRPATFDDLIGQEAVSQTLSLALDGNRLSHAYLFSGLRGSGKTSTARIFAKALLCEKGETSHPCGTCTHCLMASEGSHMDIIEMDAASNRGIDDIKDLIEHTKYKPSSARYKIFIIDEVHMLTPQAFNALLKTLEEPPAFVKFILATTDPLKLPATILSRTQHFRFKKIPQNLTLKHLEHILDLEKVGYEKEALDIIARSGAGSLRDSLTLLDQAIVYSKNFVDLSTVTGMLGIIEPSHLETLLHDIMHKDSTKILAFIRMATDYEAEMILDELTLYLKDLLLNGNGTFSPMIIERFFRVIADSKSLLALGSDGEFVLSLSLFKMMESLEIKDIDSMIRGLEQELKGVEVSKIREEKENTVEPKVEAIVEPTITKTPLVKTNSHQKTFDILIKKLYDRNYDLGVCFEHNITFENFEDNKLTWGSTVEGDDKKTLVTHWGLINMFVKDTFGFETKIVNISKKVIDRENIPHSDADVSSMIEDIEMKSSCISPEAGDTEAAKEKDPSTLLQEPMIKEAIALFDPKKVRIKRNT
ncbi:MAG: DNA polymerase III subunit gamma/tau [Sulfurovum sp.]|nr:DNA polymerase III subunit gamma/tau [Sulfurovum sp.]